MRVLQFIRDYARAEKAITAMLSVVLVLIFLSWLTPGSKTEDEGGISEKSRIATTLEMKQVSENMVKRLQEDKVALAKVSLGFSLFLLLGFFIDTLFLIAWKEGHISLAPGAAARRVPWGGHDIFKTFVVLFFTEAVFALLTSAAFGGTTGNAGLDNILLMGTTFIRNVVVAGYVFRLVSAKYRLPLAELGLTLRNAARDALSGLFAYVGFFPVYFMILLGLMGILKLAGYEPPVQTVVQVVYKEDNTGLLLALSLFIGILGPIFEEIFFRGFIYQSFRRKWGVWKGVIAVSVLFSLLHAHLVAFLPIFALSVILCLVFEKTGSLAPGMVLHMLHNTLSLAVMFQVKAFQ